MRRRLARRQNRRSGGESFSGASRAEYSIGPSLLTRCTFAVGYAIARICPIQLQGLGTGHRYRSRNDQLLRFHHGKFDYRAPALVQR